MKLLFLAEKPFMKQLIEQEFAKCRDALNYTIDVACVNNFVISDEKAERMHINTDGFERFTMKARTVPANYKIHRDYLPDRREEFISMIRSGNYAYIVNACNVDEAGDLMFDYTRESCGVMDIPALRTDLAEWFSAEKTRAAFEEIGKQIIGL